MLKRYFMLMYVTLPIMMISATGAPIRGDEANAYYSLFVFACGEGAKRTTSLSQTDMAIHATATATTACPPLQPSFIDATIFAQPFSEPVGGPFVLQARAQTTGPGVGGGSAVSVSEEVTITPPPGSSNNAATVQAGDNYFIQIADVGTSEVASGQLGLSLQPVFGSPVSARQVETSNGTFTGSLLTPEFTAFGCPCNFLFTVDAAASASNGGFSNADDGPFLVLPTGWTYSFSAPPAPTPEPGSLALLCCGLASLILLSRRFTNRFVSS